MIKGKRIIIVDDYVEKEGKDSWKIGAVSKFLGLGISTENIFSLTQLKNMKPEESFILTELCNGDAAMLVGSGALNFIKTFYHAGIRNEDFTDCTKLYRLSLNTGAFCKCIIHETPQKSVLDEFMSDRFVAPVVYQDYKDLVIRDSKAGIDMLNKFDKSFPEDELMSLDYETSGKDPLADWFEVSGFSICARNWAVFFSLTDFRINNTEEEYNKFLKTAAEFLVKRQTYIWTFNQQFEYLVSHRLMGIDLYNLCDAGVINVLDGYHMVKKYSAKWTASRVLGVSVWDTDFDRLGDWLKFMYYDKVVGAKKGENQYVMKSTPANYKKTKEWALISQTFPEYVDEFERLIDLYWGQPFMNIPADILGKYCNLDSFYTLKLAEAAIKQYTPDCVNTFLDNSRLGARLMANGLYIDEPFRQRYEKECERMEAWGVTYCAIARSYLQMEKLKKGMANINKYPLVARVLLEKRIFFGGNIAEIVKNLIKIYVDQHDSFPSGIDEGMMLMELGEDFTEVFLDILNQSLNELEVKPKDRKLKPGAERKRKLMGVLGEKLSGVMNLANLKCESKRHRNLEIYMDYLAAFNELKKISEKYLTDIFNIPEEIIAFGNRYNLVDYTEFISNNYFKSKSPIENDKICFEFIEDFRAETCWLASLNSSIQQMNNEANFYKELGIIRPEDGFAHFMSKWETFVKQPGIPIESLDYPLKVFDLAGKYWKMSLNPTEKEKEEWKEKVREIWTGFAGLTAQSTFFGREEGDFLRYAEPFSAEDTQDRFYFMRKLTLHYLLYKKYSKVRSTYIVGMFKSKNRFVIEDEKGIPIKETTPNDPNGVEKCFVRYEVNMKSSKRWSSGFHTIISHSDIKDCLVTPPARDNQGNIIYGGGDYLLSYFDISSAEVKSAGFASGDPNLIEKFVKGEDIYIFTAKSYLGEEHWEKLSKKEKGRWRKRFKTIFLGILYGLGRRSLAERMNCSEEEAEHIIQNVFTTFPKLKEYIEIQQKYPLEHDGYVNTMLGDKLKPRDFDNLLAATSDWEINYWIAKINRLGVNLPIQGGTSSIMASGFMNNIRVSLREWRVPLYPIIVVHDSNTNYFPISKVFEIRKFYDINYTEFCAGVGPKIVLLFDLLIGDSYERACPMKQIDDNTIEFSGSCTALLKIYDKIMNCKDLRVNCSIDRDSLVSGVSMVEHPLERFILEEGTCMVKDRSYQTITFNKL